MSDPKKPDDFAKTTPNMPRPEDTGTADWEKTNYNAKFSPQPQADDWGRTMANVPPIKNESDFDKTFMPGQQPRQSPEWGGSGNAGERTAFGATTPFIQLPDAERAKYQNLPPTPTQRAEQEKKEEQKKTGIPGWFWASAGLLTFFFFAVVAIFAVYFFFLRPTGFDVVILNPPPGSKVKVNNSFWSVTEGDGSLIAKNLQADTPRTIEIVHPDYVCEPEPIIGERGTTRQIQARCTKVSAGGTKTDNNANKECQEFKAGEFDKARRCANQALDGLKEPYSAEDVARALNMYIINFDVNKFDIKPNDMTFLEKASNYLKKLPPTTLIEVGGHTDSDGSDEKNQKLSENRAKSVRDTLVTKYGVNPNMLVEKGYGETRPRPGNQNRTPDEKFQNRRIEYTVQRK